ncbi:MAG: hypothetical protein AAF614_14415 [Chloroflexota bacterium]
MKKKLLYPITLILLTALSVLAQKEATPTPIQVPVQPEQLTMPFTLYIPIVRQADLGEVIDIAPFMVGGNGRLYEVQHSSGSQARHQTQGDESRFYHTKGNELLAEWEELWATDTHILRGTDTSPGNGQYYSLYDTPGSIGSEWAPRHWRVGEIFERNPLVIFYNKSNCQMVASGTQRSWLKFVDYYEQYTFESGIVLDEVIELAWLLDPDGTSIESYFYAKEYGLVGWGSNDRGLSYISEIHAPGQRPNNTRENIGCLSMTGWRMFADEINYGPLPEPYRVK